MDKKQFINQMVPGAKQGFKQYGILPSVTISQAILETGWGKHIVGNNIFGIKAQPSYTGPKISVQTTEYVKRKRVKVSADFRAYRSYDESMVDHAKLLGEASRYKPVRNAKDYREACIQLQKCGYATDPKYSAKLIQIIEQNKLNTYDAPQASPTLSPTPAAKWIMDHHISDGKDPNAAAARQMMWDMLYQYHLQFHQK